MRLATERMTARLQALGSDAHQGDISRRLGLETRRLHALSRKKAVDRLAVNAEDTADAHRIEPPVVNQPPDRLRVDAELIRYVANAYEPGFFAWSRHHGGRSLARSSVSRISRLNWASRSAEHLM
jgi:hypothetical protein